MSENELDRIEGEIIALAQQKPVYYMDILKELKQEDYRTIMLAFGRIRQKKIFSRDEKGRYLMSKGTENVRKEKP